MSNQSNNNYKKSERIGSLWVKKSQSGFTYLNGSIDLGDRAFYISIFKNNQKRPNSKDADYTILKGDDKEPYVKPARAVKPVEANPIADDLAFGDEDVPF